MSATQEHEAIHNMRLYTNMRPHEHNNQEHENTYHGT